MVSPRSVLPSALTSVTVAFFTMVMEADWANGVVVDEGVAVTGEVVTGPLGGSPLAVAVLLTTPASTSAWVMVYGVVAVQVSLTPGASEELGQVTAPAVGSLTPAAGGVTVPVLVTCPS